MVNSERDLTVREVADDSEFGIWLEELTRDYPAAQGIALEEHHLALTDDIGEWIGGIRFWLRGGVAQVLEIGVAPDERGRGHSLRLLEGFEVAARARDAHLIEFWTYQLALEPILEANGWHRVISRPGYIAGHTWHLFEKPLGPAPIES